MPPREFLLALLETRKVAAAEFAAIGRGAQSYEQTSAERWMVIVLGPGAQLHAEALGAPRIAPQREIEDESFKAMVTFAASERKQAEDTFGPRPKSSNV